MTNSIYCVRVCSKYCFLYNFSIHHFYSRFAGEMKVTKVTQLVNDGSKDSVQTVWLHDSDLN